MNRYGDKLPTAPGYRNIGSMAMQYIPVIFSGKLLAKFYAKTLMSAISVTDYLGEITKYGDTVEIRSTPDITVRDYKKGQTLRNEQPESEAIELHIDKAKYWSFVTEDLDTLQTDIKGYAATWAEETSNPLRIQIEREAFADFPSLADSNNQGNDAGVISHGYDLGTVTKGLPLTRANLVNRIVEWGAVLDEQDIPEEGRYLILPVWAISLLKTSDIKSAFLTGDSKSPIRTGLVGSIDRFNIYSSNLLNRYDGKAWDTSTDVTLTDIFFGIPKALSFASALTKNKISDNQEGFGSLYRGLQVYGYGVTLPVALGLVRAYNADTIT